MNKTIFLDYQSTTPVSREVIKKMEPYFQEIFANPHSNDHYAGWESRRAVENGRSQIANFLGCDSDEIIFTSGATEANNLALQGFISFLKKQNKTKIIISQIEHKCVIESAFAAKKFGFEIITLKPSKDGLINQDDLKKIIDEKVGLVSVMTVNNEIGTIQPIKKLAEITHSAGALFHTDAAQATSFMDINVVNSNVDLLSISAHKMYGPKGIGALYIKRGIQESIESLIKGGGQENGIRSGTLPTMLCVGLGEACRLINGNQENYKTHLQQIADLFWDELYKIYPSIKLNGSINSRHPGNLNIQIPNTDAHSLLQSIQPKLAASTGSACSSGSIEPSHVLKSIDLTDSEAKSSIRFSFGLDNTFEDIYSAVMIINDAIKSQ